MEKSWRLFYCLLLNCITFSSLFNPSSPGSLADPTRACVIQLPAGGQRLWSWGGVENLQDPSLTGGFSHLLPTSGSHPPLRLVRDRAPTGVRGPRQQVGDDALPRFQEGRWGQGRTPEPMCAQSETRITDHPAPRHRTTWERKNAASSTPPSTGAHANP